MPMAQDPVGDLVEGLLELRRGHGVLAEDAPKRVTDTVGRLCGVEDRDTDAVIRQKVLGRLAELTMALPDWVRPVVGAALALPPHSQERFLHQRMTWAAQQIDRDHPRTAHRRLEPGLRLLAEQLIIRSKSDTNPDMAWHTVELDATLRMDVDPPVLCENRTIRSLVDSLDEIKAQLSLPPNTSGVPYPPIAAAIVIGGEIVEPRMQTRTHAEFLIRLADPLAAGECHEYRIEFTGPPRTAFPPMYVMEPLRPCKRLSVRIKFPQGSAPTAIWRIAALTPRQVDEHYRNDQPIHLNNVGEATTTFTDLLPGLSYGILWDP